MPIYEFQDDAAKYSWVVSIAARYKAGTVYHRSGDAYLDEYESELLTFPKEKYDDLVEMADYAVRLMIPVKLQQTAQVVYNKDYEISPV